MAINQLHDLDYNSEKPNDFSYFIPDKSMKIEDLGIRERMTLKLSEEFLAEESAYVKKLAAFAIQDIAICNVFKNWPKLNNEERKEFIEKQFVLKLAEFKNEAPPRVVFCLTNEDSEGKWRTGENIIELPKNLSRIKDPMVLMDTCIHEYIGHGRQESFSKSESLDKQVLHLQINVNCYYIQPERDYIRYYHQPAEVHARHVGDIFNKEFINLASPELKETILQRSRDQHKVSVEDFLNITNLIAHKVEKNIKSWVDTIKENTSWTRSL